MSAIPNGMDGIVVTGNHFTAPASASIVGVSVAGPIAHLHVDDGNVCAQGSCSIVLENFPKTLPPTVDVSGNPSFTVSR